MYSECDVEGCSYFNLCTDFNIKFRSNACVVRTLISSIWAHKFQYAYYEIVTGKINFWNTTSFYGVDLSPAMEYAHAEYFSQAVVGKTEECPICLSLSLSHPYPFPYPRQYPILLITSIFLFSSPLPFPPPFQCHYSFPSPLRKIRFSCNNIIVFLSIPHFVT